jgi:serine/threonine protein phosphatase PrpC
MQMDISMPSCQVFSTWKKPELQLDISEINRTFTPAPEKPSELLIEDSLINGQFYGVCAKKGRFRKQMEDTYSAYTELNNNFFQHAFAVFDGHSGTDAPIFASKNLIPSIETLDEKGVIEAFHKTDFSYCANNSNKGGTTAALAVIDHESILAANAGDTKILIVTTNGFELLSYDHVASDINERFRIEQAGGYVLSHHSANRVCGQIAITRSLGDLKYKPYLIAMPHVQKRKLNIQDLALVIASDGLFETLTPARISEIVREKINSQPATIADALTSEAIELGSKDNITVIVAKLREYYTLLCSQSVRHKKTGFGF